MCQYINALSTESYVRANTEFVKIAGLKTAVYVEMLMTVLSAVKQKRSYDPQTGYWKVNRAYVSDRTGITAAEQRECDEVLRRLGIVCVDQQDKDRIRIDAGRYFATLIGQEEPLAEIPESMKKTKAERQSAKKDALISMYSSMFGYQDEGSAECVRSLVATYYGKGYVRKAQWEPIVPLVKACAKDPSGLRELIDFVNASNFMSIPSAIDAFMKKHRVGAKIGAEQKVCSGTMSESF